MDKWTSLERAEVLVQALPYIRHYSGQTVVVKYGGNAMVNAQLKQQVMEDIVLLQLVGVRVVLIHGGGPEITDAMRKMGKESVFLNGLRVTDEETVDIVTMVLAGKVNKSLVGMLEVCGGTAVGLSGVDGQMILAEPKDEKLGYVGRITKVNVKPVQDLLAQGYIPVVSTLGCDREGHIYNINGDTAAAAIAGALGAKRLIMMTDVPGLLRQKEDLSTLIPRVTVSEITELLREGVISGGMIPKLECCIQAIGAGVQKVIIMDGRVPHAILTELLTDEGAGTMVTPDRKDHAHIKKGEHV